MVFNSYIFIFAFFPIIVAGYFLIGRISLKASNWFLIISSLVFYGYHNLRSMVWLAISILVTYLASMLLKKYKKSRKKVLATAIILNVLMLLLFKIPHFRTQTSDAESLFMPLAISFITFSQIAYLVNVYRKEIKSVDLCEYLLYVTYFPKLIMGPIVEPAEMIRQFSNPKNRKPDRENFIKGIRLFSYGLFKKVILADTFVKAVNWGFSHQDKLSAMDVIIVTLCFTFEIYFDFSGYSDMAWGISRIMNIELPINFNSPYHAVSIQDFWKRWHISLTDFLTRYIYIPLGGNRKGNVITGINILIVFLISGFWHGSNWAFILWGAIHGILMIYDRFADSFRSRFSKISRWICTFISVNILWLLFRADTVKQWLEMLKTMVISESTQITDSLINCFNRTEIKLILSLIFGEESINQLHSIYFQLFLLAGFVICLVPQNNYQTRKNKNLLSAVTAALAITWSILSMVSGSTFIYQNF